MVKKKELKEFINEFIEDGETRTKATLSGNFKINNKAYKRMDKILVIAKNSENAENFYLEILKRTKDATTLITCCSHMMKLNIQTKVARKKLEEIKNNKEYHPLLSFNAEMFLKEWDKGNIKPIV